MHYRPRNLINILLIPIQRTLVRTCLRALEPRILALGIACLLAASAAARSDTLLLKSPGLAQRTLKPEIPKPLGASIDPAETAALQTIYGTVQQALATLPPGDQSGYQRVLAKIQRDASLEAFLTNDPNSAYGPGVRLDLAQSYEFNCAYAGAMRWWRSVRRPVQTQEPG